MTRQNQSKTNLLLQRAPRGEILTTQWLRAQGISIKLAWWYVHSGWLNHLAKGAYFLAGDKVDWKGVLSTLRNQSRLPVYIGGKTALQLLGKGHYVTADLSKQLQLFAPSSTKLPQWVHHSLFKETFCFHPHALFQDTNNEALGVISRTYDNKEIAVSAPERAAIELCSLVPDEVTFQEASLLIEQLGRARPLLVQSLLESCQSFKAKRLFLYLSEYHHHAWLNDLNMDKISLGQGKRVIAGGGQYHPKYKISVPKLEPTE